MATIDELLTTDNEVGITIAFSDFYVEVQRDVVTFYDPSQPRDIDDGTLVTLSRDNFKDIILACEVIPAQ